MKMQLARGLAVVSAALLALSACGAPPPEDGAGAGTGGGGSDAPKREVPESAKDFKACMVSDAGGFNDKSFNQTSHKGMTDAQKEFGIQTGEIESHAVADFGKNIQSMVAADCNIIITVGFLLGDATIAAAKQNPDVQFAIVDFQSPEMADIPNLKPLMFNTAESSFLAGYLAAGMSQTGKVGTFGGMNIPTVTIFMDGFAQGVSYYNEQKGKDVQIIGWNLKSQDGQFVPGDKPFDNVAGGQQVANNLVSQGADVIFPVAGPSGEGALQVAKSSGGKVSAIWVDTDGCVSAEAYCPSILSSVYKGMDVSVTDTIYAAITGDFTNEAYVGTLENEGTGISPFHEYDGKVSDELKNELDQVKADIVSGKITIESKAQPTS